MKISILSTLAMALVAAGIASADEPQLPPLKEGLWESHTQQTIQKSKFETVVKLCRTREFDKSLKASMKSTGENLRKANHCTENATQLSANSYSAEMHCEKDGTVTKTLVSYQGDTSYHMEMHRTSNQSESLTIIDDRYVGSCPADMKPGDAVTGDGTKMHLGNP
jgi:Protein of unknown function (DUF3617)